jgi:hypothetical protein
VRVLANGGWGLFISLFLGMIAAAAGGANGVRPRKVATMAPSERGNLRSVA